MPTLAESLIEQTQSFIQNCTVTIAIDGADDNGDPTYSVTIAAPAATTKVLEAQTAAQVATSVTDFTDWVTAKWADLPA